jgi:hypothetical protein
MQMDLESSVLGPPVFHHQNLSGALKPSPQGEGFNSSVKDNN